MTSPNDLHQELLKARAQLAFACAGAGASFFNAIWQTPGSSEYFVGGAMLQSRTQFDDYIGFRLKTSYCSPEAVLELATRGYIEAARSATAEGAGHMPIGVALSATVATNRMHRGAQRAFMVVITPRSVITRRIVFEKAKGMAARLTQDHQIAEALGTLLRMALDGADEPAAETALLERLKARPVFHAEGHRGTARDHAALYFPANFNPPHDGHRLAWGEAERHARRKVEFTIEAEPPNKPALSPMDLLGRIGAIRGAWAGDDLRTVELTFGERSYLEKARARPGSAFVAGADAVERMLEPNWGYEVGEMLSTLDALQTDFYVLGRRFNGQVRTVRDLSIPTAYRHRFHHLEGLVEISSSALRSEFLSSV
jgi:nicotinic acid mononucleotide adenylyltransferase